MRGGRDEELVGRIVKLGTDLFFLPDDECMCNLCRMEGLLSGVASVDSSGGVS